MPRSFLAALALVLLSFVSACTDAVPRRLLPPPPIPVVATFVHYMDDASKGITFHVPYAKTHIKGFLVIGPDYQYGDTTTSARAVIILVKNEKNVWVPDKRAFGTDVLALDSLGETVRQVILPQGQSLEVRFQLIRHGWGAPLDGSTSVFTPKGQARTEGGPVVFVDGGTGVEGVPNR